MLYCIGIRQTWIVIPNTVFGIFYSEYILNTFFFKIFNLAF
jgi:hypothetical protein